MKNVETESVENINISNDNCGILSSKYIMIPRGGKGLPPLQFDLTEINEMLSRTSELERLTPLTYPEFITKVNLALIQAGRLLSLLEVEYRDAQNLLNEAEAVARLEKAEEYLRVKGVKSSADTRDAAVTLDPDVKEAAHKRDYLLSLVEWAKFLKLSLDRMYYTAKQIIELTSTVTSINSNGITEDKERAEQIGQFRV